MKSKKYLWILFVLTLLVSMFMVKVPVNAPPKHDVAVTAVSAPPTTAAGNLVTISVDVANPGGFDETFNLTLSYDTNVIEIREVSLNSSDSKTELFSWWTLNVTPTSYTIEAEAILVGDQVSNNNVDTTTILIQTPLVTFSIDPNVTTGVTVGDPVAVNVTINTNVKIVGFRIWIKIDPAVLSPGADVPTGLPPPFPPTIWMEATEGNFLSDWATANNWTEGIAPISYTVESDGYSDTSLFIKLWLQLPHGEGASGTGTLVTFYFTSQNETAYSRIDITSAEYGTTEGLFPVDVLNDGHYNEPPAGGDVAVTNVVPAESQAYPPWTVPINVTVLNNDVSPATFTVTAYYENATAAYEIGTQTVTDLAGGISQNVTFNWSLSSVAYGTYTIKANATLIDDTNPGNDEFVDGTVKVKLPGDIDGTIPNDVDFWDLLEFAKAYGSTPATDNWNKQASFDGDDDVDFWDLLEFAKNYGKTY